MNIVFSRDRAAQLDLLLQSLQHHTQNDRTIVLWYASNMKNFHAAYMLLRDLPDWTPPYEMIWTPPDEMNGRLRWCLKQTEHITFFCDDDIVYQPLPHHPAELLRDSQVLASVMHVGRNNQQQPLPNRFPKWEWKPLPRNNFGYPCGLDGFTFRSEDVLRIIGSESIENPNVLETIMVMNADRPNRPLLASFDQQCVVGVPVNRVSPNSTCPHGNMFPQPTELLNERFLQGRRISLAALDFTGITSVHHEIQLWPDDPVLPPAQPRLRRSDSYGYAGRNIDDVTVRKQAQGMIVRMLRERGQ